MSSIDVIVPCYRYGHFLRECVVSVLAQMGPSVRVLIIDDASPDNTAEVAAGLAREDSRVVFVRHSANKGHIDTYNEGMEWASADYLLLLSADDYLLPGALERAASFLDARPEVGFVFGSALELSDNGAMTEFMPVTHALQQAEQLVLTGQTFIEISSWRNIVSTPTAVVRTLLQKRVGGYRSQLPHAGDMEMWWRLAAHASVGVLKSCQAVYRIHAANMSHAYFGHNRFRDLQQRKVALDCFLDACGPLLSDARQIHQRMVRSLSYDAVGCASGAFNDGDMVVSDQSAQLAVLLFPEIKRSWCWTKFACKRGLGLKAWRTVQPVVHGLRQFGARRNTGTTWDR